MTAPAPMLLPPAIVAALVRRRGGVVSISRRELAEQDGVAVSCRALADGGVALVLMGLPRPAASPRRNVTTGG